MSLSLEIKKFINSEHTGDYIEIELPGEIVKRVRRFENESGQDVPPAAPEKDDDEGASQALEENAEATEETSEAAAPAEEAARKKRVFDEVFHERMKIHYMEEGNGEPLILVHTIGQSYYTWRKLFYRLSENYRVIALDLPGHGYSDRPYTFGYTIEEYGEMLCRFMDALGIESAHFLAFSMGCAYVTHLALTHPERVGRMVLLSPGGVTVDMPLAVRMIDSPIFGSIACRLYNTSTVEKILNSAVFDLTNITSEVVQEYYRPASDPDGRKAIRHSLQYFDDESLISNLRNLTIDALILEGSEDKWRSQQEIEMLHAAMKTASFAVVRNAGHLLHEEKADRIIAAMLEYIPVIMP